MSAYGFPAEAERAASGVAPLSKAVRQIAIFAVLPATAGTAARIAAGRTGLETCATPPPRPRRCKSAMRLMDFTDDEAASLIRPVIGHRHRPIIPRRTKHWKGSRNSLRRQPEMERGSLRDQWADLGGGMARGAPSPHPGQQRPFPGRQRAGSGEFEVFLRLRAAICRAGGWEVARVEQWVFEQPYPSRARMAPGS
jgi:hypothetical protein